MYAEMVFELFKGKIKGKNYSYLAEINEYL